MSDTHPQIPRCPALTTTAEPCGLPPAWFLVIDGQPVGLCEPHAQRALLGPIALWEAERPAASTAVDEDADRRWHEPGPVSRVTGLLRETVPEVPRRLAEFRRRRQEKDG